MTLKHLKMATLPDKLKLLTFLALVASNRGPPPCPILIDTRACNRDITVNLYLCTVEVCHLRQSGLTLYKGLYFYVTSNFALNYPFPCLAQLAHLSTSSWYRPQPFNHKETVHKRSLKGGDMKLTFNSPNLIHVFDRRHNFSPLGDFCRLLITFATSLDPDQARPNVGPDLDPNCLTHWCLRK